MNTQTTQLTHLTLKIARPLTLAQEQYLSSDYQQYVTNPALMYSWCEKILSYNTKEFRWLQICDDYVSNVTKITDAPTPRPSIICFIPNDLNFVISKYIKKHIGLKTNELPAAGSVNFVKALTILQLTCKVNGQLQNKNPLIRDQMIRNRIDHLLTKHIETRNTLGTRLVPTVFASSPTVTFDKMMSQVRALQKRDQSTQTLPLPPKKRAKLPTTMQNVPPPNSPNIIEITEDAPEFTDAALLHSNAVQGLLNLSAQAKTPPSDDKDLQYFIALGLQYIINALTGLDKVEDLEIFVDGMISKMFIYGSEEEFPRFCESVFRPLHAYMRNLETDERSANQIFFAYITSYTQQPFSPSLTPILLSLTSKRFADHILETFTNLVMRIAAPDLHAQMQSLKAVKDLPAQMERMNNNLENYQNIAKTANLTAANLVDNLNPVLNELPTTLKTMNATMAQMPIEAAKFNANYANTNTTLASLATNVTQFTDSLGEIKESMLKSLEGFGLAKSMTQIAEKVIGLVATCVAIYRSPDMITKSLIILIFTSMSGMVSTCVDIIARLITFAQNPEPLEAQSDEITENAFVALIEVFKNMFGSTTTSAKKVDAHRISMVKSYASLFKTGKDFILFMVQMSKSALGVVYEEIYGIPLGADEETIEMYREMAVWLETFMILTDQDTQTERQHSAYRKKFFELYNQGQRIQKFIFDRQIENGRILVFSRALSKMEKTKEVIEQYMKSDKGRVRPVVIQFNGAPAVGKSVLIDFIIKDVMAIMGDTPYTAAQKHSLEPDRDFMDGYDNQFAVVMDDFFQKNDYETQTNEAMMLIKIANDATFMTNQAALNSKGTVFFDSPLVILTSNVERTPDKLQLTDLKAFLRRRDFLIDVTVAKNFAPDPSIPFHKNRYAFVNKDPMEYRLQHKEITYNELILQVCTLMKKRASQEGSVMKFLSSRPVDDDIIAIKTQLFAQMKNTVLPPIPEEPFEHKPDKQEESAPNSDDEDYDKDAHLAKIHAQRSEMPRIEKIMIDCPEYLETQYSLISALNNDLKMFDARVLPKEIKMLVEQYEMFTRGGMYYTVQAYNLIFTRKLQNTHLDPRTPSYAQKAWDTHWIKFFHPSDEGLAHTIMMPYLTYIKYQALISDVKLGSYPLKKTAKTKAHETIESLRSGINKKFEKARALTPLSDLKAAYEHRLADLKTFCQEQKLKIEKTSKRFLDFVTGKQLASKKKHIATIIIAIIGVLGTVSGAIALYKSFNNKNERDAQIGGSDVYDPTVQNPQKRPVYQKKAQTFSGMTAHALDNNTKALIDSCHANNLVSIKVGNGDVKAIMLRGNKMLTVKHIFQTYPNMPLQINSNSLKGKILQPDQYEVKLSDTNDQAYVTIKDRTFNQFRDITKYFIHDADVPHLTDTPISLVVSTGTSKDIRTASRSSELSGKVSYGIRSNKQVIIENYDTLLVPVDSYLGECGSPYFVNNTKLVGKICGIHCAGGTTAACSLVTYEDLHNAGVFENSVLTQHELTAHAIEGLLPVEASQIPLDAFETPNVRLIGCVPPPLAVRQPGKTDIVKTSFHDLWQPHKTEPAMLKPDREFGVSPFHVGLKKKLIRPANNYRSPHREQIIDFIVDKIPQLVEPRVLTVDEAINGPINYSHFKGIDRKTSGGWPYNTEHNPKGGKRDLLVPDPNRPDKFVMTPRVQSKYEALVEKHKTHAFGTPDIVVTDNMKDEGLPIEKVRDINDNNKPVGNTRIMNTLPCEALVEERQFFGAFFENIIRWQKTGNSFCDLGINPDHVSSWEAIHRKIKKFIDPVVNAGDLKKQDASTPDELSQMAVEIIIRWYRRGGKVTEEQLSIMRNLHTELSNVIHLAINLLYQATGNPSGRFLTTIQNSIVTLIVFLDAALDLHKSNLIPDMTQQELLEFIFKNFDGFGDDHLHFIERNFPLDMFAIQQQFAKYGMEYTGIYKNRPLIKYYEISEVKFLQRFFNDINNTMHGALDKETIEEIVYWRKRQLPDDLALPVLVDAALRQAYHWGPEYFLSLKEKYNTQLAKQGYTTCTLQYSDLQSAFYGTPIRSHDLEAQMNISLSDKTEVDAPTSKTVQTTTFADNVGRADPKVETPITVSPVHSGTNPYKDQGLQQVLSRPYPVASFTWSSNDAMEAPLAEVTFPKALNDIPYIAAVLARFQYMRSDVGVSIRINTTAMHAGRLICVWTPHYQDSGSLKPFQNIYTASCLNHSIISANTNVTTDFIIPYVAPSNYWNMKDDPATTAKGFFGHIQFYVLHPLSLLGVTTEVTANITVYAHFLNPEIAGMGLRTIPALHAQMQDSSTNEAQKKSDSNSIGDVVKSSANTLFKTITKSFLPDALSGASSMLSDIATSAIGALFLDKPTSTQATQKILLNQVSSMAHVKGLDGCEKLSADPENHVSTNSSLYCMKEDYNLFKNYKMLPGLVNLGYFDNSNPVGYKPFIIPISPTYCHSKDFTTFLRFYLTPVGYFASYFKFWRGGIKIHIIFTTNKFATARVRLTWLPDPTFSASFAANEEGDTVNRIVDITGDTSTSITIPYLKDAYYDKVLTPDAASTAPTTSWEGANGQLVMSIINPVANASSTVDSRIYFAVYMSGAEDFEVQRPVELWEDYGDGTDDEAPSVRKNKKGLKLEAQMSVTESSDMRAVFRKTFEPLVPATTCIPKQIQMGESIDSWSELMKRYTQQLDLTAISNTTYDPWTWTVTTGSRPSQWTRTQRIFLFSRGSVRYKVLPTSNAITYRGTLYGFNTTQDETFGYESMLIRGATMTDTNTRATLELEVPFYTKYNMMNNDFFAESDYRPQIGLLWYPGTSGALTFNGVLLISAGDDFTYGYPSCPLPVQLDAAKALRNQRKTIKGGEQPFGRNSNKMTVFNNYKA